MNPIEAYASTVSVYPGEFLALHVRAEPGHFNVHIEIYRQGETEVLVHQAEAIASNYDTPINAYEVGCRWSPAYEFVVPSTWTSGVYIARFISSLEVTTDVLFVVKFARPSRSKILLQLAINTYQAYNNWGGKSLYSYNSTEQVQAREVSFDRPLNPESNFFIQWDIHFVRWVESNGFAVDYCTNVDLHAEPNLLNDYTLFLSIGHDEYWSKEMRDRVEAFIAQGGNVAFFGGNICWWQARLEQSNRTLVCYRDASQDPVRDRTRTTVRWRDQPVNRPEEQMTGVSFAQGAFWSGENGDRPAVDYRVRFPQHWVFEGTGLEYDAGFGAAENIIGYETDAAEFREIRGVPVVTGVNGTPRNFIVLAFAALKDWGIGLGQAGMATMGIYRNKGTVFTSGTVEWARGLQDSDSPVSQITRNVLTQLSRDNGRSLPLVNANFEQWLSPSQPAAWRIDGDGQVLADSTASRNGAIGLRVNATHLTWISQEFMAEGHTLYQVECWVKADRPGATLRLQSTQTWRDFAIARHSGSGDWELIRAIGKVEDESPMFSARVKLQVEAGVTAMYDQVRVEII
ncbi:MAG: hypothetical protein HC781_09485 [Leptolyngbyaceae cyanobacterium CSU_1_4]|nr:hypothetical protein [Leptolyngbyaceae cyanobacterium CSU_1_4]